MSKEEVITQLERQLLEQHDAAGFHQTYRGPQGGVPDFVLREPDAVLAHFVALLAPPTAASPPEGSTAAGGGAGAAPQEGSVAEAAAALAAAEARARAAALEAVRAELAGKVGHARIAAHTAGAKQAQPIEVELLGAFLECAGTRTT